MEDKFTQLNLNGVEKYVSAIYDGSGNDIEATYETIKNVATKESDLSERINTTNETLETLTNRVAATEAFANSISQNANDIKTNADSINALEQADETFQESLDSLTIKVGTNTTDISNLNSTTGTLSTSFLNLNTKVGTLEAIVNDETSGINALNTQADENTSQIAKNSENITKLNSDFETLSTSMSDKISTTTFEDLVARVVALEAALAANHPVETPESGEEETESNE